MHRHLTLEQYEWALEDAPYEAQRMLAAAATCGGCAVALSTESLTPVLSAWELPPSLNKPVDWRDALRVAVAVVPMVHEQAHFGRRPLALGAAAAAALMALTVVPAAASAGPDSPLFGVRSAQEHARLAITPEDRRAALEADLATSYLVMAHENANHQDRAGYESAMGALLRMGRSSQAGREGRGSGGKAPGAGRGGEGSATNAGAGNVARRLWPGASGSGDPPGRSGRVSARKRRPPRRHWP